MANQCFVEIVLQEPKVKPTEEQLMFEHFRIFDAEISATADGAYYINGWVKWHFTFGYFLEVVEKFKPKRAQSRQVELTEDIYSDYLFDPVDQHCEYSFRALIPEEIDACREEFGIESDEYPLALDQKLKEKFFKPYRRDVE